jgi:hypothetical protein
VLIRLIEWQIGAFWHYCLPALLLLLTFLVIFFCRHACLWFEAYGRTFAIGKIRLLYTLFYINILVFVTLWYGSWSCRNSFRKFLIIFAFFVLLLQGHNIFPPSWFRVMFEKFEGKIEFPLSSSPRWVFCMQRMGNAWKICNLIIWEPTINYANTLIIFSYLPFFILPL